MTSCAIEAMTQPLEHELEMVASGTIVMSAQNTRTPIDHLCAELQTRFDEDGAELQ